PFDVIVVGCTVALKAAVTLEPAVALKAVRLDVVVARAVTLEAAVTLQPAVALKAVRLDVVVARAVTLQTAMTLHPAVALQTVRLDVLVLALMLIVRHFEFLLNVISASPSRKRHPLDGATGRNLPSPFPNRQTMRFSAHRDAPRAPL